MNTGLKLFTVLLFITIIAVSVQQTYAIPKIIDGDISMMDLGSAH